MRTTDPFQFPGNTGPLLIYRLALAVLCALGGLPAFGTLPALADLRVCNQTGNEVSIALGYRVPNGWQSEGWWVAPPSQCATVFEGDLSQLSRYFYIFAADDIGGGAWDGNFYLCTTDESFTIFGYADCLARGYERTGFFEVDTKGRSDWMLQLTDAESAGRPETEIPDETIMLDDGAPMEGEPEGELTEGSP
jgi:uncharacterized membrane protein